MFCRLGWDISGRPRNHAITVEDSLSPMFEDLSVVIVEDSNWIITKDPEEIVIDNTTLHNQVWSIVELVTRTKWWADNWSPWVIGLNIIRDWLRLTYWVHFLVTISPITSSELQWFISSPNPWTDLQMMSSRNCSPLPCSCQITPKLSLSVFGRAMV